MWLLLAGAAWLDFSQSESQTTSSPLVFRVDVVGGPRGDSKHQIYIIYYTRAIILVGLRIGRFGGRICLRRRPSIVRPQSSSNPELPPYNPSEM